MLIQSHGWQTNLTLDESLCVEIMKDRPESIPAGTQLLRFRRNRRQTWSFHIQCREAWEAAQIQNINHVWGLQIPQNIRLLIPHLISDVEKSPAHAFVTAHSPTRPVPQRYKHLPCWIVHDAPARLVQRGVQPRRVVPLPLDSVVHTLLPVVVQLVELDVVLDEGVGEQAEHQQHQRLGRAVQHRAQTTRHHHQHLFARGETELRR